jgi:hypothetical protein
VKLSPSKRRAIWLLREALAESVSGAERRWTSYSIKIGKREYLVRFGTIQALARMGLVRRTRHRFARWWGDIEDEWFELDEMHWLYHLSLGHISIWDGDLVDEVPPEPETGWYIDRDGRRRYRSKHHDFDSGYKLRIQLRQEAKHRGRSREILMEGGKFGWPEWP